MVFIDVQPSKVDLSSGQLFDTIRANFPRTFPGDFRGISGELPGNVQGASLELMFCYLLVLYFASTAQSAPQGLQVPIRVGLDRFGPILTDLTDLDRFGSISTDLYINQ